DRLRALGRRWREETARMQIPGRRPHARERPGLFVAPVPADKDAALGSLVSITAAHDVDAYRRIVLSAVVNAFEPVVEPAQLKFVQVDARVGRERRLSRNRIALMTVNPWADNQFLRTCLARAERREIDVGNLVGPGIVPAGDV